MYDGTIFIGGNIGSFGSDAVESEITESIKSLKNECTVVVVSHKLETLKYSDHIINLDKQIY